MANFSNPIGPGLTPERIDMGVDFGGSGPLYALGHGTVVEAYPHGGGSGWPGGGYLGIRLDDGREIYYAEDLQPLVALNQVVTPGQHVADATGGPSGIEVGWASGRGTSTEAAQTGQAALGQSHGDAGRFSTAFGVDMANLIHSLGGPLGRTVNPIQGTLPANWQAAPSTGIPATTASALGGVFSWPGDIVGFFKDAKAFVDALLWIVNPASWLRIGAFMAGTVLILLGIYTLLKIGSDEPLFKMPQMVPIPV